ncbi:MAG: NUDIX hydrolase [Halobacteriales archaeon]|nr:NUDIX hydrolase [Halobacteriales archaeon]
MSEALRWETLGSTTDYECPGFAVRRDEVRLPDGTETDFHSVVDGPSVVVLPFTPDGDVVVIDEWRQAVGRVSRGLPAGGVEPEDPDREAAAGRELTEETGYVAESVEPLVTVEPANGLGDFVFSYHVARGCTPDGERALDDNESIAVTTVGWDALVEAALAGELRDGRSLLGVSHAALAGVGP